MTTTTRSKSAEGRAASSQGSGVRNSGRTGPPQSVRRDWLLLASLVLVAGGGLWLQTSLAARHSRDWSLVQPDSVFLQTLEGIIMGFKGSKEMTDFLAQAKTQGWAANKNYVVTGGNRGLGRAIAVRLLALGANVVVTARSVEAELPSQLQAEARQLSWPGETRDAKIGTASVVPLDLADLRKVQETAAALARQSESQPVDGLILNAGLAPPPGNDTTKQGFELALGVNAIGHHYLVRQLQDKKVLGRPGQRIVVVTSETFRSGPPLDFEHLLDPVSRSVFNSMDYYARSKLAVNTLSNYMARQVKDSGLKIHMICPGPVATDIGRSAPGWVQPFVTAMMNALFQTPDQASWPVLMLAVDPRFGETTGQYYHMYAAKAQRSDATDAERGRQLTDLVDNAVAQRLSQN